GETRGENLRLGFEPAESSRVNNTIAIARVLAAIGMWRFRIAASMRVFRIHGPGCKCRNSLDGPLRGGHGPLRVLPVAPLLGRSASADRRSAGAPARRQRRE